MISVIIPCYNIENYLSKSVKSIINQAYDDVEIILVNDGSTDNTLKICEQLKQQYLNVKVINQSNEGVSSARNNGILAAKGEYICLLDGDDFLDNNCFKKVMEIFKEDNNVDMCFYGFKEVSENGEVYRKYEDIHKYPENKLTGAECLLSKAMRELWICTGSCIYKKSILDKFNIKYSSGYKYGEHINFINTYISYSKKIGFVKENFLNYLMRNGSATRAGINPFLIQASNLNRDLYKTIECRDDLNDEEKNKMLVACDVDYIHLTTSAAKNVVENTGSFSFREAEKFYDKFKIIPEDINISSIEKYLSKAKKIEWKLFCSNKLLFFSTVKFYRMMKR